MVVSFSTALIAVTKLSTFLVDGMVIAGFNKSFPFPKKLLEYNFNPVNFKAVNIAAGKVIGPLEPCFY